MNIEEVTDGTLFKRGDVDSNLIYLLSGKVILQADGLVIEAISANTEAARFALAHQIPRKIDAVAKGTVRFLRLDANKVNNLPPFEYKEDTSFMSVDEAEVSGDDWMTALLKLPVFQRLPPANLQKILMGLELVEYDKGVTVIEQGASGDYYYLIKSGQCLISRRPSASAKEIKLGVMDKGDTFGEDSLITGAPRTVTITALTDLSLLRLNKQQFISLIKEPSLKFVEYEELGNVGTQGGILMDIRAPDEYEKRHLESSVNFPFFSLRMQLKTLSRDKTIVVICADGKLSEAGAFLLLKNKFNALILKGGMAAVPAELVREFAQFTIDDGIETLVDPKEADLLENRPEPEGDPSSGAENGHWENQIKFLKLENEALRRTNQLLNEKYEKLKIEKSDIEKEYRIVYQKLESMMRLGESR
ncbi:MAG: cyclic nucleotide-binding domain-containing protein [Methylosarcina sp.]